MWCFFRTQEKTRKDCVLSRDLCKHEMEVVIASVKSLVRKVTLVRLLKLYGIFALLHLLAKVHKEFSNLRRAHAAVRHIPGPRTPIIKIPGELKKNQHRLHELRLEKIAPFRDQDFIRTIKEGIELLAYSEDAVNFVFTNENVTKVSTEEPLFDMLRDFLGHGIFVLRHGEGNSVIKKEHLRWKIQRQKASLVFTKNRFNEMAEKVFNRKCERLVEVIGGFAGRDEFFDLQRLFFSFTMDGAQEIFFGLERDTLTPGSTNRFGDAFDAAHSALFRFLLNGDLAPWIILSTKIFPFPFGSIFGMHRFNLTLAFLRHFNKYGRAFDENIAILREEVDMVVEKARTDSNLDKRNDLLALFIKSEDDGMPFSSEDLKAAVLSILIAARDTTASTLSWLFFELSINPDVQKKLIQEIDEKLGGKTPSHDDLSPGKMPYLNGVVFETLRKAPAVPENVKEVTKATTFKGMVIPANVRLIYSPYVLGRDPIRYPDPERFEPNRWIPFEMPSEAAFPNFQGFPRLCLGRPLALFEIKLVVVALLQHFTFTLKEGEKEKISYALTITSSITNNRDKTSNNLWMKAHQGFGR